MNFADKLTFFRITLAPVFFAFYVLPEKSTWTVPVLWAIFVVSGITDLLDGLVARKFNQVSDFGKLFDPFSDTLVHLTYFLCFVIDGLYPVAFFLIVIYREFSILFIRNLMLKNGISLGARVSGKIKTSTYTVSGGAALLVSSLERLNIFDSYIHFFKTGVLVIIIISIIFVVISFFDYFIIYKKNIKKQ